MYVDPVCVHVLSGVRNLAHRQTGPDLSYYISSCVTYMSPHSQLSIRRIETIESGHVEDESFDHYDATLRTLPTLDPIDKTTLQDTII